MEDKELLSVDKSKLTFVQQDATIFDQKFETKKIGYLQDALIRFGKNKGSVVAFVILCIMILFSIIVPFISRYSVNEYDLVYANVLPKIAAFEGSGFWDGTQIRKENVKKYEYYYYHGAAEFISQDGTDVKFRFDSYKNIGYQYLDLTTEKYNNLIAYCEANPDIKILYPLVDRTWYKNDKTIPSSKYSQIATYYDYDANYYYKIDKDGYARKDENGEVITVYLENLNDNPNYITGEDGYVYAQKTGSTYRVRVFYDEYYKMLHDGKSACFAFGADNFGKDIYVRLATGGRLSLLLGFSVSLINIIIGLIYGSIEGYYGGVTDLIMERIIEILNDVPFIIIATLFQMYFAKKVGTIPTLLFAFVLTGWIGVAGRTRMQFYRYKGQEYVLAARTLGARDGRLIFRHILPNAVGPIITGAVLMVPGVIFSESMLSYLNIIDLSATNLTSIGTMLNSSKAVYTLYPHEMLFPAIFISLLMICFNIFGNGLRDAFNPSLRGVDE